MTAAFVLSEAFYLQNVIDNFPFIYVVYEKSITFKVARGKVQQMDHILHHTSE